MINKFDIVTFRYPYGGNNPKSRGHILYNNKTRKKQFLPLQSWKPKYGAFDTMYYVNPADFPNNDYPFLTLTGIDCSFFRCTDGLKFDNSLKKGSISSHQGIITELNVRCNSIVEDVLDSTTICRLNSLIAPYY